ncbi:MAG: WYL domain-containing protein [Clostridia bacterium]|nr:WYL domain-containing protein [Clostridia bacterium]
MPKKANQKNRILEVLRFLFRESDEEHPVTVERILRHLDGAGFSCDRKTVMDDLAVLAEDGWDVIVNRGRGGGCFLGERTFETAELKLLIDAVQSPRFIPLDRSRRLIAKLTRDASVYEEQRLKRELYVSGRVPSENRELMRTVDALHTAISSDKCVSFVYYEWMADHTRRPRRDGKRYFVSPCLLSRDSDYYYLLAYDRDAAGLRHFRVDKIGGIRQEDQTREGRDEWEKIVADPGKYEAMLFGMYSGKEETVVLSVTKDLAGVVIDRFGTGCPFLSDGEGADTFRVSARVVVSPVFLSWAVGFGDRIRILSPDWVRDLACDLAGDFLSANAPDRLEKKGDTRE